MINNKIMFDESHLLHFGVGALFGFLELKWWVVYLIAIGKELFDLFVMGGAFDVSDAFLTVIGYHLVTK